MHAPSSLKSLMVSGTYFPPQVGGISRMMAEVCQHLGRDRIAAVSGQDGGDLALCQGLRTYCSPAAFDTASRLHLPALAALLGRAIVRERPGLLQFATADDAWIGWYTARLTRLPHLIYAHGNEILALARSRWAKPLGAFQSAAAIIANSRYTAGLVEERLGVSRERIHIVHPGCDIDRFRPVPVPDGLRKRLAGRPDAYPLLLSVGNLVERKGQDLVLRALPELRRRFPAIAYAVVGDGRDRPKLEALCRELGLDEVVNFVGRGNDADLPAFYAASDLFVMPSRARLDHDDVEGFGMVFLEASACGKAVIGGRSGGIADAIAEGETGLLVDPEDPGALAAAIRSLAESPDTMARFGQAGLERTRRDFTWARFCGRIDAALAGLGA
ncbi:MAG: glycosyltransferase family 4 protein [Betaproteobacteria bacterium]|nr:glycosyltransferase family 4 protein [Betaproteobacteria bacterium]MBK8918969.1 glycosyltransferase family 4 protein [Betaproteobacteria bacterium]